MNELTRLLLDVIEHPHDYARRAILADALDEAGLDEEAAKQRNRQGYKGWFNHATWVIAHHFRYDERLHEDWLENADEICFEHGINSELSPAHKQKAIEELAGRMVKTTQTELLAEAGIGWVADLSGIALDTVDWAQIAEFYLQHAQNDEPPMA